MKISASGGGVLMASAPELLKILPAVNMDLEGSRHAPRLKERRMDSEESRGQPSAVRPSFKPGKVTISGHESYEIKPKTLKSIQIQAGLK